MGRRVSVLVVSRFRVSGEALAKYIGGFDNQRYEVTVSACVSTHEIDSEPDIVILACIDDCPAGADAIRALLPRAKLIVISRAPSAAMQAEWIKSGVAGIVDEGDEGIGLQRLGRVLAAVQAGEIWAPRDLLTRIVRNGHALAEPQDGTSLTPREQEMLALLHLGLSNADIGTRLFISEKTVKAHLTNVYRKLGVANRVQATLKTRGQQRKGNPGDSFRGRGPSPCASPLPIVEHRPARR